jgi:hypothetical protein
MTAADIERLLREGKLQETQPDRETALAEIEGARRHIASAEKIVDDDPEAAFTLLYDALRQAIVAHMRASGYRVTRGFDHVKTGEYGRAALDHLDIDRHLDEFDHLRAVRHQSEYEALRIEPDEVKEAFEHATAVVDVVARELESKES